jgi:hypothetical protein
MANVPGPQTLVGATNNVVSNQIVIDMSEKIHLLEPDATPLTALTRSLKASKTCHRPKFEWLEDILLSKVVTLTADNSGAGLTGTTTVTAADLSKIANYDVVKNPRTGDIGLVTNNALSGTTFTVTRSFGTTAAAAWTSGDILLVIGSANKEYAAIRSIIATQKSDVYNYAQIFRTPFGFSRVARDTEMYGEQEKPYQTRKRAIEHKTDIERAFLFGQPYEETDTSGGVGGDPTAGGRWATGGIDYFISSNRKDAGGALTYNTLLDWAQDLFRYGNKKERICIAAPVVLSSLARMAAEKLLVQEGVEEFGLSIFRILTPHGKLMFINHPLLSETSAYNERCYALDMDNIRERPFVNANTKLLLNRQQPSVDGEEHEYLTQVGLEVALEKTHGVLYNIGM